MRIILITILNIIIVRVLYFFYNLNIFLINGSGASATKNIERWALGFLLVGLIHDLVILKVIKEKKFKIALTVLVSILYVYYYTLIG